ncbi:MAG TPA: hypothetical protein EYP52_01580 [Anaerolineae bacterium]|nr:hypothetical protein [Anaerolineae bacterium]
MPRSLRRRAPVDDRRILLAYWQYLLERGPALAYTVDVPGPTLPSSRRWGLSTLPPTGLVCRSFSRRRTPTLRSISCASTWGCTRGSARPSPREWCSEAARCAGT